MDGQRIGDVLRRRRVPTLVVDLSPRNAHAARDLGLSAAVGDATSADLLERQNLAEAQAVAIALPDLRAVLAVIRLVKTHAPDLPIVARARYDRFAHEIEQAGAQAVNKKVLIGKRLGMQVARHL